MTPQTEEQGLTPGAAAEAGGSPPSAAPGSWSRSWTLYKKELRAYFDTPTAYIVVVVFLLITGYLFSQALFLANQASLGPFLGVAPLILVFVVPGVTMRLVSEELKTGTFEILATLPVKDHEILLSKFAAALTVVALALGGTFPYPAALFALGRPDAGAVAGTYLGLFLTGAVLAAAGLFASTLTRNQIIAFILGFLIGFVLFLAGEVGSLVPFWLTPFTEFIGIRSHLENLAKGVVDTRDLLYFLSVSAYFLFLGYLNLDARRWR